jgi:hypothetical protein
LQGTGLAFLQLNREARLKLLELLKLPIPQEATQNAGTVTL